MTQIYSFVFQVECSAETKGTKGDFIQESLKTIKRKCDRLNVPYPEFFTVDDCCAARKTVHKILPDSNVTLDLKHFVSRMINHLSTGHPLYGDASREFHGLFVGPELTVLSKAKVGVKAPGKAIQKDQQL